MPKSRMRRASMTMCRLMLRLQGSSPNGVELPVVEREPDGERIDLAPHRRDGLFARDVAEHFRDQRAHLAHLRFLKTAGGDGWRPQADAARVERRIGIEWDGVLVDRDARPVERLLGLLAAQAFREHRSEERR